MRNRKLAVVVAAAIVGVLTISPAALAQAQRLTSLLLGRASTTTGSLTLYNAGAAGGTRLIAGAPGSDIDITLPGAAGTIATTAGNVATATSLAANGANCDVGSYSRGSDEYGAAEGCTVSGGGTTLTDSASLAAALSDETGTGLAVFATSPTLTTPILGVAQATSLTLGGTSAATVPGLAWNTTTTLPTAAFWTGSDTNCLIVTEHADSVFNFAPALSTYPCIKIFGAAQITSNWIQVGHNGTDGVISTGTGTVSISYPGLTTNVAVGDGITATGSGFVAIGSGTVVAAVNSVVIGSSAQAATTSVAVGNDAEATGGTSVALGANTRATNHSVALGSGSIANGAQHQFVAGSDSSYVDQVFFGEGVLNASPLAYTINGTGGTGTNIIGADVTIAGGRGTGTGVGGDVAVQTPVPLASGTTAQTLGSRGRVLAKYTALTAATATAFARVAVPTGTVAGGDILVTIEASDATDFEVRTMTAGWTAQNKAGTTTTTLSTPTETGTADLVCALTLVDSGSGNVDFKLSCVATLLVETVLRANALVNKNFGTGAISAQ